MSGAALAGIALVAGGLAGTLAGEGRGARGLVWVAKPLASTGFLVVALASGALDTAYGKAVLAGLALSWWGDVLLIPRAPAIFRLGIAAFLLGHVGYGVAFLVRGVSAPATLGAAAALAAIAAAVLRWLRPHVGPDMRVAVVAYVAVISAMVALAVGTVAAGHPAAILAGALGFYVSDLAVARERFVRSAFANRLVGLPLYYAAQVVLALTVAM